MLINERGFKTVFENFLSLTVLQFIIYLLPLITTPYIAKTIGIEKYGLLAFASAFCNYFVTIIDYGFNFTALREVSKMRNDIDQLNIIYSSVLFSKVFLLLLSFSIFLILVFFIPKFNETPLLFLFSFIVVINNVLYPQWFFQGIEKMKFLTILNLVIYVMYIIGVFSLVKEEGDYILLPLILGLATFIIGIYSMLILHVRYKIRIIPIRFEKILETLRGSTYVFLNQLLPNLYNNSSTFILSLFAPIASVGLFSAAQKIIGIGINIPKMFTRAFYPHLAANMNSFDFYKKSMLLFSAFVTFMIIVFGKMILGILYTPEFNDAIELLYVFSIGAFFYGVYDCFGTNYLIPLGKDRLLFHITLVVSIIGFLSAWPSIIFYGAYGAAITIAITRGLMGIGVFYFYKKIKAGYD